MVRLVVDLALFALCCGAASLLLVGEEEQQQKHNLNLLTNTKSRSAASSIDSSAGLWQFSHFDHANVRGRAASREAAKALLKQEIEFYGEVLGLVEGFRPPSIQKTVGAWLYSEGGDEKGHPVVHLEIEEVASADADAAASDASCGSRTPGGYVNHFAVRVKGESTGKVRRKDFEAMLMRRGSDFEVTYLPATKTWQVFVKDPAGAKVETMWSA